MNKELKDVYVITNTITREQYVGQSKDTHKRWLQHKYSKDKLPLHQAIQAYGHQNFTIKKLESQIENYNEREKYWIKTLKTEAPYGYNLAKGGNGYPHMNGVNCYQALFNHEQLQEIIQLLKSDSKPMTHIAKQYNVGPQVIYGINYGWHYRDSNIEYPIRAQRQSKEQNPLPLKELQTRLEIKARLEYPQESTQAIAEDYGVLRQAIEEINQGKSYYNPEWDYPLRKISYNPKIAPKEIVEKVRYDLKNTKKSMRELGREYNINRSTVSLINLGNSKYYFDENIPYPIRKIN